MAVVPRCKWCKSRFVEIDGHYWCETASCRDRQAAYSISVQDAKSGASRFLWVPLPVQVEVEEVSSVVIRNGRSHKILLGGAAGPGKSTSGRNIIYRRCFTIDGFQALILRENFPELEKSHIKRMAIESNLFKDCGVDVEFTPTKFRMRFGNSSQIDLGHLEDERALTRFLSTEYDAILADEAVLYKPDLLLGLIGRARTVNRSVRRAGGPLFLMPTNPGGPSEVVLRDLCIDKNPDLEKYPQLAEHYHPDEFDYLPANLEDNPYLDPEYEADLALNHPVRFQQLRYNNWDVVVGQFFDKFDSTPTDLAASPSRWTHVADLGDPPPGTEWFRSMDWGYSNPGCVLWWACLSDSLYYIRYLWKFDHMLIEDVADRVLGLTESWGIARSQVRYTACDPSVFGLHGTRNRLSPSGKMEGETMDQTFASCGLPLIPADNDRRSGWHRVREMLRPREDGRPWVVMHPECRYLIRTMSMARCAKHDPEDIDTNSDDHGLDTFRYGAMSRPAPTRSHRIIPHNSFLAHQRRLQDFRRRMAVR